ncbi:T9SS type A sorting domain-containing protein [Hymenobacter monticola]|uniref:T9SS type A sorting domain-containing protein n=1 Tax=Hymenobacter monticola TaxID=1705399 RepID=A0ABY4B9R8_9BACT|nr:T9SS type A sorting domain-containing protein [Hymenobacter monticola]UOE34426.1 T9SS type A sorting domain-containing protein [Hymenobacter monticola]
MKHWYLLRFVIGVLLGFGALPLAVPAAHAQGPTWQTAVAIGQAPGSDTSVSASAVDGDGNVLMAGSFTGTAVFGATTLTSAGNTDVFVAKWSPATGSFIWAQRAGGAAEDRAVALAVQGNAIYLAGYFNSLNAGFGSVGLVNVSSGNSDGFVVKLTDAGATAAFGWAQGFGGAYSDGAYALAANGNNVYLAGQFNGAARFGSTVLTTGSGSNVLPNGFVAKLTDAGASSSFTWVRQVSGASLTDARALVVDGPSVYIAGYFNGTAGFGASSLTSVQFHDGFVAKLADAGATASFVWVQPISGPDHQNATVLVTNGRGTLYVAGNYTGPTDFGNIQLFTPPITSRRHIFVAKLLDAGPTGRFAWAVGGGGSGDDDPAGLAISGNSVYLAGTIGGMATFGSTVLNTPMRTDGLIAKLTDAGTTASFAWAQQFGGVGFDFAGPIVAAGTGLLYLGGSSELPASFGPLQLSGPANGSLGFLATLTDASLTSATVIAPAKAVVSLFPNPAHGRATVLLPVGTGPATLTVLDALGRPVRILTVTGIKAELDLTGLAPGLYAVQVQAGAATATRRLVVE